MARPLHVLWHDEGLQAGATQLGGGQRARLALFRYVDPARVRVTLVTSTEGDLAEAARAAGCAVVVRPLLRDVQRFPRQALFRRPVGALRAGWRGYRAAREIARLADTLEADILHPNDTLSRCVAVLARPWRRVPAVTQIDNLWGPGPVDRLLGRAFGAGFDALIPICEAVRRVAAAYTRRPQKLTVIPEGLALDELGTPPPAALRSELGLAAETPLILSVGSLFPVKGHADMMAALPSLVQRFGSLCYAIAGTGPEATALETRRRELGLPPDSVRLLGARGDVAGLLRSADAVVQPSHSEALPLSVVEALWAGAPIVATDVGGTAEILDGGRLGWLVAPGDPAALAGGVEAALALSPAERARLARDGPAWVRENFDIRRTAVSTTRLYEALAAAGKGA